jgi:4-amino-4-deoxy-L-arabinose transferase-like glycosyltransferase
MKLKRRFFLFIAYIVLLLCLLPAANYTYKHPAYNFDMLGYMALVLRIDQKSSIEEIHRQTYTITGQKIPATEFKKLTETPPYRKKFETDPGEFKKILPNYIVKPLYVWSCWLFYKSGVSLPMATVLPSIIAYLILGLFLFYWLSKRLSIYIAFAAALFIMLSTFVTAIARLSTPDILSALFVVIAFYFILEKRNLSLMFAFFLLSILTRVDNIITCFFILSFLTFSRKWKRISIKQYLFATVMMAILYVFIILPVREFGWSIFYYSQYAKHIDYSRDFEQPVSFLSHLSLIYTKLVTAFVSTHFTLFAFMGLLVLANKKISINSLSFDQAFLLVLIFIGLFKFLLLPDLSDRFYMGFYLTIIILLVRKFYSQISMNGNENS